MLRKLLILLMLTATWQMPLHAATSEVSQSLQQVTLEVRNMSCGMCKYTVENALKQVKGVKRAEVDMDRSIAVVTFDPARASVEVLVKAVRDAGYPAAVRN